MATPASAGLMYSVSVIAGSIQTCPVPRRRQLASMPETTSVPQPGGTLEGYKTLLSAKPVRFEPRLLGGGFLGLHVDDLDAAVGFRHRLVGILQLALAISDGDEIAAGDAVFVDQIALDRVGAALGQVLIVLLA